MEHPTATHRRDERAGHTGHERAVVQSHSLKVRHAHALTKLLDERTDLKGTHAFADLVSDALRWSA